MARTRPHRAGRCAREPPTEPTRLKRLQDAIVSYSGPENALKYGSRFKAANYKADWAFMRELSAASGIPLSCT